jgi:S1-C subfamily serine protease
MKRTVAGARAVFVIASVLAFLFSATFVAPSYADRVSTIEQVKASIVAVGTFQRTRTPPFQFRGTGFVVDDGTLIVTNAHVLPPLLEAAKMEVLAILVVTPNKESLDLAPTQVQVREAKQIAVDPGSDLAVLRIAAPALPALKIRASDAVKEGQEILFTGYPIGAVLGAFPATHRGMISAITPIAIPQARAGELDPRLIKRLSSGPFAVFQLDATAYPGNSGSPIYDPDSGEVLGVINMVFVKGTKESALTQPSGITYAVPAIHLRELLKKSR